MKERTRERSAACATCGKSFARSDTLLRHEKSHHNSEDRGPVHRVTNGTFRACVNCAQARSRCSGGEPCGRCKVRGVSCEYPVKRRRVEGADAVGGSVVAVHDFGLGSQGHTTSMPYGNGGQQMLSTTGNQQMLGEPLQLAHPGPVQSTEQPQFDHAQQYNDPTLADSYAAEFGMATTYPYDNSYEDPLNWIPLSYYPSPFGEMEQDLSFLLPNLSDTASAPNDFMPSPFMDTNMPALDSSSIPRTNFVPDPAVVQNGNVQSPVSSTSDGLGAFRFAADTTMQADSKKRRRKSALATDVFLQPRTNTEKFAFPEVPKNSISALTRLYCSDEKHSIIADAFRRLCVHGTLTAFTSSHFPNAESFNACIELYFDHFHHDFSILHNPTINDRTHWLVLLAAAAIGCTFAKVNEVRNLRNAFQELLRRACHHVEDTEGSDISNISLAQARLLNLISVSQSERDDMRRKAPRYHAEHSRWCLEAGLLQVAPEEPSLLLQGSSAASSEELAWQKWIHEESLRRLAYFSWLLDTSLGYLCNARPLQNMDDARAPMPCHRSLWEAGSAHQWHQLLLSTKPMPSLCDALEELYAKKSIDSTMSEVSHTLLIHALISRTWEVGTHIKQPLSEWKSTGKATGFLNTPVKDNFWLPLYPLYANWRNSACDCLDVLHWHASSVAAQASGEEHDAVLHLHLARVILLTPFQELQDLVFFILDYRLWPDSPASFYVHDGSYQTRDKAKAGQIKKITWRWLREDQHKARLAIIHAGSVFWHVRRYSNNTFFEPTAVYLASIVLWVYGSFKSSALAREAASTVEDTAEKKPNEGPAESFANVQPTRVERAGRVHDVKQTSHMTSVGHASEDAASGPFSTAAPSSEPKTNAADSENDRDESVDDSETESSPEQPEFIYLDRPNDDEMVQHFVRGGHNFTSVSITNVGDICQHPTKVLQEGAKLLKSRLACWGISREYHDILIRLSEMRKTSAGTVVPLGTPAYKGSTPKPPPEQGVNRT